MRRTLPVFLALLLVTPFRARAQTDEDAAKEDEETPKKKSKGEAAEAKPKFEGVELTPKRKKADEAGKTADATDKPASDKPEVVEKADDKPSAGFARHRYGYIIGGGFLVAGLAFAYSAQGEAKRAETIGSAREASQALDNARASAATANVIYGVATATLVVALLFEFLPEPIAQKASLTFHF